MGTRLFGTPRHGHLKTPLRFSLQLKWKKKKIGEEKNKNKSKNLFHLPGLPALKMKFQDRRLVGMWEQGTRRGQWVGLWKFAFNSLRDLELVATGVSGEAEALL